MNELLTTLFESYRRQMMLGGANLLYQSNLCLKRNNKKKVPNKIIIKN